MPVIKGVVERGAERGKALGYPTANIALTDASISGIYAAQVCLKEGEAPYMAAVFADPERGILEAHLLDFDDDLYGQAIAIELHEKVRDAAAFDSDEELKTAIRNDLAKVREHFKN